MFGSKDKKIEKEVLKGEWYKINIKFLKGDSETRLLLAQKCAKSKGPAVNNVLTTLIRNIDEKVQLAAIQ